MLITLLNDDGATADYNLPCDFAPYYLLHIGSLWGRITLEAPKPVYRRLAIMDISNLRAESFTTAEELPVDAPANDG